MLFSTSCGVWPISLTHPDCPLQVTIEQQALEDYLLTEPALKTASSHLLAGRTTSPDIVTQVVSQLSSKAPQELWTLIHTDAVPAGKAAGKTAAAKAPAAVKGKPGSSAPYVITLMW